MTGYDLLHSKRFSKRLVQQELEEATTQLTDTENDYHEFQREGLHRQSMATAARLHHELHAHGEAEVKKAYDQAEIRFEELQQRYEALLRDHDYQQDMLALNALPPIVPTVQEEADWHHALYDAWEGDHATWQEQQAYDEDYTLYHSDDSELNHQGFIDYL